MVDFIALDRLKIGEQNQIRFLGRQKFIVVVAVWILEGNSLIDLQQRTIYVCHIDKY